jgi:hypothetical protein
MPTTMSSSSNVKALARSRCFSKVNAARRRCELSVDSLELKGRTFVICDSFDIRHSTFVIASKHFSGKILPQFHFLAEKWTLAVNGLPRRPARENFRSRPANAGDR